MNPYSVGFLNYGQVLTGGRNSVVKATHSSTGEQLVVKTMPINQYSRREVEVLSACTCHDNVVTVYSIEQIFNTIVIVMKQETGGSLVELLQKGPLPDFLARDIFLQLVDVVSFLHNSGIAHRDIKLDNILLNENQDIVLIDFEFSTYLRPADDEDPFCGTPEYSAPEVRFRKKPVFPDKLDIWSLGIVLYVLVCGFLPFTQKELKKKTPQLKIPVNLPPKCQDLIRCLLQSDATKRPSIFEASQHPWLAEGFSPAKKLQRERALTKPIKPSNSKDLINKRASGSRSASMKDSSKSYSESIEDYEPSYCETTFAPNGPSQFTGLSQDAIESNELTSTYTTAVTTETKAASPLAPKKQRLRTLIRSLVSK